MAENLTIKDCTLSEFFKNYNRLSIPLYQRGYAWETQQVEELWDDLQEKNESKRESHFYGQIVLNWSNNENIEEHFIIDGQQRVTTSLILISVIRNKLQELYKNNNDDVSKIRASDIQKAYFTEDDQSYHLKQSDELSDYFKKTIQQIPNNIHLISKNLKKKTSASNVYSAYTTYERKITAEMKSIDSLLDRRGYLLKLLDKFTERFYVIVLSTPNEADAFVIFETLNARGRELNASDLLKNHILRNVSENTLSDVKNQWNNILRFCSAGSNSPTKFIRSYWNSTNKQFVVEKALYKTIYNNVKCSEDVKGLVNELEKLAPVYEALADSKNVEYFENDSINELLITLLDLNIKTYYPIILALVNNKYRESEILTTLHKIYSFVVRNYTIGGLPANKYEKIFASIAYQINQGKLTSITEINNAIISEMLDDASFRIAFCKAEIKTEKASKRILRDIMYSDEASKINLNDVKVITLNDNINSVNLIANKVLVTKKEYAKIKKGAAQTYGDKMLILENSKFSNTRKRARENLKDTESIMNLQRGFADKAIEFWK